MLPRTHEPLQLSAMAQFSDGSTVDVTRWTVFTAEDSAAVRVSPEMAVAEVLRRGRHLVVARYLNQVVPIEILVPLADEVVDLSNESKHNFIDQHVLARLSTLRLPVSRQADAATFLAVSR